MLTHGSLEQSQYLDKHLERRNDHVTDVMNKYNCACLRFGYNFLHFLFVKGVVTESESLFMYKVGLNYHYYNRPEFEPAFNAQIPPNSTGVTESQVQAVCGANPSCTYDYRMTLNENIARSTLNIQAWATQMKSMAREGVLQYIYS